MFKICFIFQNFVSDFASTSRDDVFSGPDKVQLLNQVICQHFYRQGMLDIADELAQVEKSISFSFHCLYCNIILEIVMVFMLIPLIAHWARLFQDDIHYNTRFIQTNNDFEGKSLQNNLRNY